VNRRLLNTYGLFDADMYYTRCSYRVRIVQQQNHTHATGDETSLQGAVLIQRSLQAGHHGAGTKVGMSRNTDGITAKVFNVVMTTLGLDVNQ